MQSIKNAQLKAQRDPSQTSLQGTSEPDWGEPGSTHVHMSGRQSESSD